MQIWTINTQLPPASHAKFEVTVTDSAKSALVYRLGSGLILGFFASCALGGIDVVAALVLGLVFWIPVGFLIHEPLHAVGYATDPCALRPRCKPYRESNEIRPLTWTPRIGSWRPVTIKRPSGGKLRHRWVLATTSELEVRWTSTVTNALLSPKHFMVGTALPVCVNATLVIVGVGLWVFGGTLWGPFLIASAVWLPSCAGDILAVLAMSKVPLPGGARLTSGTNPQTSGFAAV